MIQNHAFNLCRCCQIFERHRTCQKTLTIPQWADKLGKRAGINFSVLLTESIADKADNILRSGRNN